MANKTTLKNWAVVLLPEKAVVVSKVLRTYLRKYAGLGPTEACDTLDNDVGLFWSPSYRDDLNRRGRRISDAVFAQIADPALDATSVDRTILFLLQRNLGDLRAFEASCRQKDPPFYHGQTVYARWPSSELDRLLTPKGRKMRNDLLTKQQLEKTKKSAQTKTPTHGGGNVNTLVREYADLLARRPRVQAVHELLSLARYSGNQRVARWSLSKDLVKAGLLPDDSAAVMATLGHDQNTQQHSPDRTVRFLLSQRVVDVRRMTRTLHKLDGAG